MASIAAQIAQAVTDLVTRSGMLDVVERAYALQRNLEEMPAGRSFATIYPVTRESQMSTRRRDADNAYTIQIVIEAGLSGAGEVSEVDGLMELCEDVANYLRTYELDSDTVLASWREDDHVLVDQEFIEREHRFISVLNVTYVARVEPAS